MLAVFPWRHRIRRLVSNNSRAEPCRRYTNPSVNRLRSIGKGKVPDRPRNAIPRGSDFGAALVLVSAPEYWLGLISLYLFATDIGQIPIFPGAGSYVSFSSEAEAMRSTANVRTSL